MFALMSAIAEKAVATISAAAQSLISQLLLFADLGELRRRKKTPHKKPKGELVRIRALAERERRRQRALFALGLAGEGVRERKQRRGGKSQSPNPSGATEQKNLDLATATATAIASPPPASPHLTGRRRPRPFKPLASEIYNLPAALIDWIVKHELDLRLPDHLRAAHAALDKLANTSLLDHRDPQQTELEYWEEMEGYCDALDRLAVKSPVVALELARVRDSFEAQKATLHASWSLAHAHKQNCYKQGPVTYEPQSINGMQVQGRDVFE